VEAAQASQVVQAPLVGPQARATTLAQKIALVDVVQHHVEPVQEILHHVVNNVHNRPPLS
jgi:hypothetical protein